MIEPVPVGDLITTLVDVEKRFAGGSSREGSQAFPTMAWRNENINRFYLNSAGALRQGSPFLRFSVPVQQNRGRRS